jgi:hypothetical protein
MLPTWRGNRTQAWTVETAMFALAAAATGRAEEADRWCVCSP